MLVDEEELAGVRKRGEEFAILIDNKIMTYSFIEEDLHHDWRSPSEEVHR